MATLGGILFVVFFVLAVWYIIYVVSGDYEDP